MSRKLKVTEKLRVALQAAVEEVKPIRERIRTTRDRERYGAWNEKRAGSNRRRDLHLAICYLKKTPYRKAEARTYYDGNVDLWYILRDFLVRDVSKTLIEFDCVQGKSKEDVEKEVRAWIGEGSAQSVACPPVRPLKLYVVVREDLPPGVQAVQAAHAMREFTAMPKRWNRVRRKPKLLYGRTSKR